MVKGKSCDKSKGKTKSKSTGKCVPAPSSQVKKQANILAGYCCCECGEVISDDTRALQCERCVTETWKCTGSLGLSDELYDELAVFES